MNSSPLALLLALGPLVANAAVTPPAAAAPAPPLEAVPASPPPPPAEAKPVPAGLTLDTAVAAALNARPELAAGRARVEARHLAAGAAIGAFIPRLTGRVWGEQSRTPLAGPFNSYFQRDDTLSTQRLAVGVGVLEDLPTGTQLELRADGSVGAYTYYAEALNPRFEPALRFKLSQQLWKGLSPSANLSALAVAEAEESAEEAALAARAQAVALEVAEAWLDASRAAALVTLRQQSVELAGGFEKLTQQLIEGGSLSRLDLALAAQTVAGRKADLAAAEADRDLAASRLGELLGPSIADDAVLPVAAPLLPGAELQPSLDEVTAAALATSPELRAARAAVARQRALAPKTAEAWAPSVKFVFDGSVSGVAGNSTCQNGFLSDGIAPCHVPDPYQGGADKALSNLGSGQLYSIGVGVEGELPTFWGPWMSSGDAASHDVAAAESDVTGVEQRLRWRARRLLHDMEQRRTIVEATRQNLRLAADALEAEETKLRGGRSTGFALLRAQELRVGAELQETDARYQLASATARLLVLMGRMTPAEVAGPGAPSPQQSAGDKQR